MQFDPNNNTIKLCAEGMSLEGEGKKEAALPLVQVPAGTSLQTCTNICTSPDVPQATFIPQTPAHTQIHSPAKTAPINLLPTNNPYSQKHNSARCCTDNLQGFLPILL